MLFVPVSILPGPQQRPNGDKEASGDASGGGLGLRKQNSSLIALLSGCKNVFTENPARECQRYGLACVSGMTVFSFFGFFCHQGVSDLDQSSLKK